MSTLRYISDSQRTSAGCSQRWFLSYGLGLVRPAKDKKPYLGILWSQIMHRLRDRYDDETLDDVLAWIDRAEKEHLDSRGQHFLTGVEETAEAFGEARRLLKRYVRYWKDRPNLGTVIFSERRLDSAVLTANGHPSTKTGWLGYLDKLVEINGDLWVVDHKSTSIPIADWREKNQDKPQGLTYAWLVRRAFPGRRVRGIIFDVAYTNQPRPWTSFEKINTGKRLRKPQGIPHTTADQWGRAIIKNGFGFHDTDKLDKGTGVTEAGFYITVGKALRRRDERNFWFHRIEIPITDENLARAERELYLEGTRIRLMRERVAPLRAKIKQKHEEGNPSGMAQAVSELCHKHGAEYPRNPSMCHQFNRKCDYASLCKHWSPEAAGRYVYKTYREDRNGDGATDTNEPDDAGNVVADSDGDDATEAPGTRTE